MKVGGQDKGVTCGHARRRSAREFSQVMALPTGRAATCEISPSVSGAFSLHGDA